MTKEQIIETQKELAPLVVEDTEKVVHSMFTKYPTLAYFKVHFFAWQDTIECTTTENVPSIDVPLMYKKEILRIFLEEDMYVWETFMSERVFYVSLSEDKPCNMCHRYWDIDYMTDKYTK